MRRKIVLIALGACGAAVVTAIGIAFTSPSSAPTAGRHRYERLTVGGDVYHYRLYVPSSLGAGSAVPLVVVIHGCTTTADQQAAASNYNPIADRRRFVVLYPDVDQVDEAYGRCWKGIWDPAAEGRGRGDARALVEMTRAVMTHWRIDPARVYAIGISAGAFETAILGADYPDLYAAIGIHSGAGYLGGEPGCLVANEPPGDVTVLARAARVAMRGRARVMPVIVLHGDRDDRVPYRCGEQALAQWLRTDDLVLRHERRAALPSTPTGISHAKVPGGRAYTVRSYADRSGCPVAELWTIHGMGHYWSGGSADPASARYSDPQGPSAAAASWAFFSRWRLSGAAARCVGPVRAG
jgi:poly(hydroxyalkanoate) depolymerase family esterase